MLAREDFAEPADATCDSQDRAEDAHRHARQQAREHQRESKSQNKGPRGRCRYFDLAWGPEVLLELFVLIAALPFPLLSVRERKPP